jgi:hypothetical protein
VWKTSKLTLAGPTGPAFPFGTVGKTTLRWVQLPAHIAMSPDQDAYDELCCYTLAHGDRAFIHQYVVDAFAAQNAHEQTKPIALTFALVGLYLHIEKQFSGRQVQRTHMNLARTKRSWPVFPLPKDRGVITAATVKAAPAGPDRNHAIDAWCTSVWQAFHESHQQVADLLRTHGVI